MILAGFFVAPGAVAQGRCDEATVRRLAAVSVPELAAPDLYFNVVAGDRLWSAWRRSILCASCT